MKKVIVPIVVMTIMLLLGSCGSTKKIVYFQGADTIDLSRSRWLYEARIMPKDLINIRVNTSDPNTSKPFNRDLENNNGYAMPQEGRVYGYLVDNDGNINFPMVGTVHVEGLTTRECENVILNLIKPYMAANEKPIVTVRMTSYHVTIIGEAGSRIVPVTREKMSIVEAIASAGDLTVYGKRDNILLIREDKNGQKSTHRLDISKADILNSPYYYLQQNDIIYIEPNKAKLNRQAINDNSIWLTTLTMIVSLGSVIVTLIKK
ncbi:MAG: polysaccharide biosynthesis/export family protein [Prevotella sp.]|uniref:polysaccharide biosynthesis/export family protein n=1 Tax=Prevotella sp. TaxID=59823 RepID=UPI002A32B20C|nr:polysaccharide biosynthesis/export family protein [Prevotella sp.]MDD7318161.1 polysaccharide biosynthesis/export family protein [Prevotellaceae bacterium]MDY4020950.1 polysaccharide biosynthesis/export family protein [Prevotella sp.]